MPRQDTTVTVEEPRTRHDHLQETRVVKKLRAGQPGTLRWRRAHGDALVCVRYRHDALKLVRFTTIEIVVDARPILPRRFDLATFGLKIGRDESDLRFELKRRGARWSPHDHLWWARGSVIRALRLAHRIVSL